MPQIGWNSARFTRRLPILDGLGDEESFDFVNSYHVRPAEEEIVLATTEYGAPFCSMVARENLYASQFHIEKSGEIGLRLLKNFARL